MEVHRTAKFGMASLLLVMITLMSAAFADTQPPVPTKPTTETESAVSNAEITNSLGTRLVLVRAGNFRMGSPVSDKQAEPAELPQHRVKLNKPFYLGKFEVTRGEFRQFVAATKYTTDAEKGTPAWGLTSESVFSFGEDRKFNWLNPGFAQTDEHPVVNVSWNDAIEFCRWLSKKESKSYRLPTEAEWEWACRAGSVTRWSCGDDEIGLQQCANIADASLKQKFPEAFFTRAWNDGFVFTSPVGKLKPNAFGLHDMHGNVSEWCSDWYDKKYYAESPVNDPAGPQSGTMRVIRGSRWVYTPDGSRSARRLASSPSQSGNGTGFRLVLDAK